MSIMPPSRARAFLRWLSIVQTANYVMMERGIGDGTQGQISIHRQMRRSQVRLFAEIDSQLSGSLLAVELSHVSEP